MKAVLRGQVILPHRIISDGVVEIEGERILDVYQRDGRTRDEQCHVINYGKKFISPGFIDLHVHGARGRNVMDADMESFNLIGSHLIRSGVTGFLPTTLSSSLDCVGAVIAAVKAAPGFPLVSKPLGVHVEGPFLNPRQRGVQDCRFIKKMTEADIGFLADATKGIKALLTMAPEVGQNQKYIPLLREIGVVVALGHSEATYEQALEGIEAGITYATHLFNAMREFHHREPGAVGAVLESDKVMAEIIADGFHVHPANLNLALDRKGYENICLVTDSVDPAGLGDGGYTLGNQHIELKDARVLLRGSNTLAGSVLRMNEAVKNVMEWSGLPINQAVQMASLNPARVLVMDKEMGSIAKGKYANLTVFDREFRIIQTYVRGKPLI